MSGYRCQPMAELARQMRYTPPARRQAQLAAAERLYWQIDPARSYPASYIVYQITGYRSEEADGGAGSMLVGEAVRSDLLALVLAVSETLEQRPEDYEPRSLSIKQAAERLGVTQRTVNRYLKQGLFARKLIWPTPKGPRKKLSFLPESVERFVASRGAAQEEAARFARIDEPTRHAIITRARRIAGRTDASANRVAQHLARKFGRSTEAVRQVLRRHDEHDPRFAIFPLVRPALRDADQRRVVRAYRRGAGVSQLCERYGKTREAIYRTIAAREAAALVEASKHYVPSPTFQREDAAEVIMTGDGAAYDWLSPALAWAEATAGPVPGSATRDAKETAGTLSEAMGHGGEPWPGVAGAETALFARMNYLKHRAHRAASALNPHQPAGAALDEAATWLRGAAAVRRRLAWAYLPVVASVARQHAGASASSGRAARGPGAIEALVAAGRGQLLAAIDRFDAGRGRSFERYLRWALMRWYARGGADEAGSGARGPEARRAWTMREPMGDVAPVAARAVRGVAGPPGAVAVRWAALLEYVCGEGAAVLSGHLGLPDAAGALAAPVSIATLSERLRLEPERVRRIEREALRRLAGWRSVVSCADEQRLATTSAAPAGATAPASANA